MPFILSQTQHVILHALLSALLPTTLEQQDNELIIRAYHHGKYELELSFRSCGHMAVLAEDGETEITIFTLAQFENDHLVNIKE